MKFITYLRIIIFFLAALFFLNLFNTIRGEEIIIDFSDPDSVWEAVEGNKYYKHLSRSDFPLGRDMCRTWAAKLGGDKEKSGMVAEYGIGMHLKVICYGNVNLTEYQATLACVDILWRTFLSVDRYIIRCGDMLYDL